MLEQFEDNRIELSDWDRAIAEAERQFALQPTMDELEDPGTSEARRREIYRILGAVLVVVSIPVVAVVAAKKISEILKRRKSQNT
jgi:hypothetical protein